MKLPLLLTFFLLCFSVLLQGQIILQMDGYNTKKTVNFYEGEEITVRLKGEEKYHTFTIVRLIPETNTILTQLGPIQVEDIVRYRSYKGKKASKALSLTFYNFGASWVLFSLGAALVGNPLTWSVAIVGGTSALIGFLIRKIFKQRTYKIGKKRRMRILDLNPVPPPAGTA